MLMTGPATAANTLYIAVINFNMSYFPPLGPSLSVWAVVKAYISLFFFVTLSAPPKELIS